MVTFTSLFDVNDDCNPLHLKQVLQLLGRQRGAHDTLKRQRRSSDRILVHTHLLAQVLQLLRLGRQCSAHDLARRLGVRGGAGARHARRR